MKLISLDVESYQNYFLLAFKSLDGKIITFELSCKFSFRTVINIWYFDTPNFSITISQRNIRYLVKLVYDC